MKIANKFDEYIKHKTYLISKQKLLQKSFKDVYFQEQKEKLIIGPVNLYDSKHNFLAIKAMSDQKMCKEFSIGRFLDLCRKSVDFCYILIGHARMVPAYKDKVRASTCLKEFLAKFNLPFCQRYVLKFKHGVDPQQITKWAKTNIDNFGLYMPNWKQHVKENLCTLSVPQSSWNLCLVSIQKSSKQFQWSPEKLNQLKGNLATEAPHLSSTLLQLDKMVLPRGDYTPDLFRIPANSKTRIHGPEFKDDEKQLVHCRDWLKQIGVNGDLATKLGTCKYENSTISKSMVYNSGVESAEKTLLDFQEISVDKPKHITM